MFDPRDTIAGVGLIFSLVMFVVAVNYSGKFRRLSIQIVDQEIILERGKLYECKEVELK